MTKQINKKEKTLTDLIYSIIAIAITAPIPFLIQILYGTTETNVTTSQPRTAVNIVSNLLSEMIQGMLFLIQIFCTVIALFSFIYMLLAIYELSNNKDRHNNKKQSNNQNIHSNKKENQVKSDSLISLNVQQQKKSIFRPNVNNILSMIQYVEDLQTQIKNSLNISSSSSLQLSRIDKSIFIKFNILQEKFISDYQAVDWNNNINQEISNSYQKIYDEHEKLLKEQYDNIKQYLKEYFNQQVAQSKEELDVINKIIN